MGIPPGAIGNGLSAEEWARLEAVPFPVMQHLMVALRSAGIAAYATADIDESPLRALGRRNPLQQRIHVDRSRLEQARVILAEEARAHEDALLSSAIDSDVDTEFANLVAQLRSYDAMAQVPAEFEETQSHFEPPAPDITFSTDPVTRAAWVGLIGGPVLLLLSLFGVVSLAGFAPALGVIAFISGFVTLVMRMPDRLPIDEGPDDGAVV